jgi:hypothetical protein
MSVTFVVNNAYPAVSPVVHGLASDSEPMLRDDGWRSQAIWNPWPRVGSAAGMVVGARTRVRAGGTVRSPTAADEDNCKFAIPGTT